MLSASGWAGARLLGSAIGGYLGALCRPAGGQKSHCGFEFRLLPTSLRSTKNDHHEGSFFASGCNFRHRGFLQFGSLLGLAIHLARIRLDFSNLSKDVIASYALTSTGFSSGDGHSYDKYDASGRQPYVLSIPDCKDTPEVRSNIHPLIEGLRPAIKEKSKCRKESGDSFSEIERELTEISERMEAAVITHHAVELILAGDRDSGVSLLLKAATIGGAEALFNLGVLQEEAGHQEEALGYYKAAARFNYPAALFNLAVFHQYGQAGLQPSSSKAADLYRKAALQGLSEASAALHYLQEEQDMFHDDVCGACVLKAQ